MNIKELYDVVVVGAGISGAIAALAMSRENLKVLVIEANKHPRFAIGESTVPITTIQLDAIAEKYNIPELRNFTRYSEKSDDLDMADYPKALFWYGWHKENDRLQINHETMFETLDPPSGPDVHMIRSTFDGYLVSCFDKYGIDYLDETVVEDQEYDQVIHSLVLKRINTNEKLETKCPIILDASGHSAYFSKKFGFLEEGEDVGLKTNTRCIYSHFDTDNMPELDDILGGPSPFFRYKRSAGTMHHVFKGGWIWIIPFDNNSVSIGLVLDRNVYPEDLNSTMTAKEEFFHYINKWPSVAEHIGQLKDTMPFVRKNRMQLMSKQCVADGVLMMPHSSAFIDALFSTGISQTTRFILNSIPFIKRGLKEGRTDRAFFKPLEDNFFRDIRHTDTLVAGIIESFRHPELFKQFWRCWCMGSLFEVFYFRYFYLKNYKKLYKKGELIEKYTGLQGANVEHYSNSVSKMYEILVNGKERDPIELAGELKSIIDQYWFIKKNHPLKGVMEKINSPYPHLACYKRSYFPLLYSVLQLEYSGLALKKRFLQIAANNYWFFFSTKIKQKFSKTRTRRQKEIEKQFLPWHGESFVK